MADPQEPLKPLLGFFDELENILNFLENRLEHDDFKNIPDIKKVLDDLKDMKKRAKEAKDNYKVKDPQLPPLNGD